MSNWFAQNRESRKHQVQRPRKEGKAGKVVHSQMAVVWHPTDLAKGTTTGERGTGNRGPGPR